MRKGLIGLLAFAMLATSWLPASPRTTEAAVPLPASLLVNGDFETDADANGIPDGWTFQSSQHTGALAGQDSQKWFDGEYSAKITIPAGSVQAPGAYAELVSEPFAVKNALHTAQLRVGMIGVIDRLEAKVLWYDQAGALITTANMPVSAVNAQYNNLSFSGWQYIAASAAPPSTAKTGRFQLRVVNQPADAGAVYFDDVRFYSGTKDVTGNIIPNGDFERDATGDGKADNWTITKSISSAVVDLTAGPILEGDKSLRVHIPSGSYAAGSYVRATSPLVRLPETLTPYAYRGFYNYRGSDVNHRVNLKAIWYDAANQALRTDTIAGDDTVYTDPTVWAGWRGDTGWLSPPTGADRMKFELEVLANGPASSATFYFDQLFFGKNSLINGSFESDDWLDNATLGAGPDGQVDGWSLAVHNQASASASQDSTRSADGAASGMLSVPTGSPLAADAYAELFSDAREVQPGASLLAKLQLDYRGKPSNLAVQVRFYDEAGIPLATKDVWSESFQTEQTAWHGWTSHELTVRVPEQARTARVGVRAETPDSSASWADVSLDDVYLGINEQFSLYANNEVEDILDMMWDDSKESIRYWQLHQNTNNEEGRYGTERDTYALRLWYKQTAGIANAVAYTREYNLDIEGYERIIVDESAAAGVLMTVRVQYLDTANALQTATDTRAGVGRYVEVPIELTNPKKLLNIELEIADDSGSPEVPDELCSALYHWIMLKKPGSPVVPVHAETAMKSPIDNLGTMGLPLGLLFDASDLPALRQKILSGTNRDMWEALLLRAETYLAYEPEADIDTYVSPTEVGGKAAYSRDGNDVPLGWNSKIMELAFAYLITERIEFAEMARRVMLTTVATPEWTQTFMWRKPEQAAPERRWAPFVEAATVTAMSLGYDWLYHTLTESERTAVRDAIRDKGIAYLEAFLNYQNYWKTNNQGLDFAGSYAIGSIAIGDATRAQDAKNKFQTILTMYFKPQGDTDEGGNYWLYSASTSTLATEILTRYNPAWVADLKTEGLENTMAFLVQSSSMAASKPLTILNFNESGGGLLTPSQSAAYFAKEYQNGLAQWVWESVTNDQESFASTSVIWGNPVLNLLYYDTALQPDAPELPRFVNFEDTGTMYMRSGWEFGDDLMLGFLGGPWSGGHSHMDKNSFVLEAYGTKFAVDRGGTVYADPALLDYQHTKSHNTITLDGGNQIYRKSEPAAQTERQFHSPLFDFFVSEGKDAYNDPAAGIQTMDSYKRHILYARPDMYLILDEIEAAQPSAIEWNLHTRQSRSVNGDIVTFADSGASLDMGILLPAANDRTLAVEDIIKGDRGNTTLYDFKMTSATAKETESFLTAFRPRRNGDNALTATRLDADTVRLNASDGSWLVAYGSSAGSTVETDAKLAALYTPVSAAVVRDVGMMNGTALTYGGTTLIEATMPIDAAVEWLDGTTVRGKIHADGAGTVTLRSPSDPQATYTHTFTEPGDHQVDNGLRDVAPLRKRETLQSGWSKPLLLQGRLYDDGIADLSSATISYASSNAAVASVSGAGVMTGVSVGSATVTASVYLNGYVRETAVDVTVVQEAIGNLIANGGFENGLDDWEFVSRNGGTAAQDTANAYSGTASLKLSVLPSINEGVLNIQAASKQVDMRAGDRYAARFRYKAEATTVDGATGLNRLQARMTWFDADGYRLGGQSDPIVDAEVVAPAAIGWTAAEADFEAPAGAVTGRVTLTWWTDQKNVATLWLDDVELERIGTNMLVGASFEDDTDLNGIADGWHTSASVGACGSVSFSRDAAVRRDGDWSHTHTFTSCGQSGSVIIFSYFMEVDPAKTYDVRFRQRYAGQLNAQVAYIIWYDAAYQEISRVETYKEFLPAANPASVWTSNAANDFAPPSGAAYARVQLRTAVLNGSAGQVWYDELYFGE